MESTKYDFVIYLIFGVLITAGIMWTTAWWGYYSTELLMSHYGYDFDAMNETERFESVKLENLERVKKLKNDYLGIGWPAKAIMAFVFYSPYLLIVYFGGWLIRRIKRKNIEITNLRRVLFIEQNSS